MIYDLRKTILLVITILTSYILHLTSVKAYADTSQNDNYIFHMNVNTDPDEGDQMYTKPIKKILQNPKPLPKSTVTPSPTPIPLPTTKITIGYTDKEPVTDLSFTISDTIINLGPLLPGDVIARENSLIVHGDPSYMYSIFGYENHQLHDEKNTIIPNTTCDDGTCSSTTASLWTNVLTYGFGYRCDSNTGHDCVSNFENPDFYSQFADNSVKEPQTAFAAGITFQPKKETITYKLNIAGSQQAGYYNNTIAYLAMPMY